MIFAFQGQLRYNLKEASEIGKEFNFKTLNTSVTFCLRGDQEEDLKTKGEPLWMELLTENEEVMHFSLREIRAKNNPNLYTLVLRSNNFPMFCRFQEFFRMFENGEEIEIIREHRQHYGSPLTIKSNKLKRTYSFTLDDTSCVSKVCPMC